MLLVNHASLAGAEDLQAEAVEGAAGLLGFDVEHALQCHWLRTPKRDLHLRRTTAVAFHAIARDLRIPPGARTYRHTRR